MKKLILSLILIFSCNLFSQDYKSHKFENNILEVECDWANFKFIPYTDEIIKVHFYPNDFNDEDEFEIVIANPKTNLDVSLIENVNSLRLKVNLTELLIEKKGMRLTLFYDGKAILKGTENQWKVVYQSKIVKYDILQNEALYGLGSKAINVNRRNISTVLFNQNIVGYEYGESWLNTNIPLIISSELWGIFFDGHSLNYFASDIDNKSNFQYVIEEAHMSFFLISGDSYSKILNNYLFLTGHQKMLPRWALGYMQSKFGYYSENDTEYRIYGLHQNGFPVDAVIFDFYWFGSAENMGNLEWSGDGWKDPAKMVEKFEQNGVKTILISEPFISENSKLFNEFVDNKYYTLNSKTGTYDLINAISAECALIDIFNPDAADWIMQKYANQMNYSGIHGWWLDLIEPESQSFDQIHAGKSAKVMHNMYSIKYADYMYKMMLENFPGRRPFMMYRGGWSGAQNVGLTFQIGDEKRSWLGLKGQVPIVIGMSMTGAPWIGTDIGGFFNLDSKIRPELHLRWFQFGAFNPVMRMHIYGIADCEPHLAPKEIREEIKELLKLRYKLLPYNYNLIYENHVLGLPPVRQSDFYHPENEALHGQSFQYYWGDKFFVAPVVDSGAVTKEVTLPPGKWIDYFTHETYEGNKSYTVDAPMKKLPLFIKSGSILPTAPEMLSTSFYDGDSLIVEYYPDLEYPESEYKMYDDDGETPDSYSKNLYQFLSLKSIYHESSITINLSKEGFDFNNAPKQRNIYFKIFYPDFKPGSAFLNELLLNIAEDFEVFNAFNNVYFYDEESNILHVKFDWNLENTTLLINDVVNSINGNNLENIVIYPNPFEDNFEIEINSQKDYLVNFELIDINGKSLLFYGNRNISVGTNVFKFETDNISNGTFIIKISSSSGVYYQKIVKNK